MILNGKKIAFLGDSITEGVGAGPEKRFSTVFCEITGAVEYNYGISGTRIARQFKPTVENLMFDRCFLDRVDGMIPDADVVVVFGGTNDFGHGDAPFGTLTSDDEYTFCGAVHSLINRIINKYPEAQILFITPLHRHSENFDKCDTNICDGETKTSNLHLRDYVNAIKDICEMYSIPVLDLWSNLGIQPKIKAHQDLYMPDGLHPSPKGAERIAEHLAAFLRTIR